MSQITVARNWLTPGATVRCLGCGQSLSVTHQDHIEGFALEHARCHHPAQHGPGQWRLGDYVAHLTHLAGIKQCEQCKKRQAALNRFRVPWGR